jgi:hypothetical protein
MKARISPALQWNAEIDIGPFAGRTTSGNVIPLAIGYLVGNDDFVVAHTSTESMSTPKLCGVR